MNRGDGSALSDNHGWRRYHRRELHQPIYEGATVTQPPNQDRTTDDIVRGAYIVASHEWYYDGKCVCATGDLALVFGARRGPNSTADVLLENGRTLNAVPKQSLVGVFRVVYVEADFVICGCSSHEGWDKARALLSQSQ